MLRLSITLFLLLSLMCEAHGQSLDASPFLPANEDLYGPPVVAAQSPRLWAEVDYLLWWMKPVCEPPATVTVGSPTDAKPGAIGQPGTIRVMGGTRYEFPVASGVRPTVGIWFDDDRACGVFASGIILPTVHNTRTFATTPAGPNAYLPYETPTGSKEAIPFAIPGLINGSSSETGSSGLWGAEINAISQWRLVSQSIWQGRVGAMLGARYMQLDDGVHLQNTQTLLVAPFSTASSENRVETKNQFRGPQFGFLLAAECGRCELEFTQKLAIGSTRMEGIFTGGPLVSGSQLVPGTLPGPLVVLPSNVGTITSERVTLLPELNAKLRVRLRDHVRLTLGYNFIYWNRIFCPGDLMNKQVNLTQLPEFGPLTGTAEPSRFFARTDYFAQGLELGLQVEY